MANTIKAGVRIVTSGEGRTKKWGVLYATCVKKRGNSVFVKWDNSIVEEEMDILEVSLYTK